jgi:tetratricopeptide (TPR) repeat protein
VDFESFRTEYSAEDRAHMRDRGLSGLLEVLARHGKLEEVEQLLSSAARRPDEWSLLSGNPMLLFQANFYARTGRWRDAATNLVDLLRFEPDLPLYYFKLAPLRVASNDLESYGRLAEQITTRFGGTNNILRLSRAAIKAPDADWLLELEGGPEVPFQLAVACLIVPVSPTVTSKAAELAESGALLGKPGSEFGKGLAEYRMGHFTEAVDWAKKVPLTTPPYGNVWSYSKDSEVYALLAMSHWRLNNGDAAREALSKGIEIWRTKLPKLQSGDIGEAWSDWIICRALLREAKALVLGSDDTNPDP